jgi:predicted XRE-type DNA-binding protein
MSNIGSKNRTTVTLGSANVFADLGITDPDLALAKVQLAERIALVIGQLRLTKAQAALRLGIDQTKLSAIVRGRVRSITIDQLLRFDDVAEESIDASPAKSRTVKSSP